MTTHTLKIYPEFFKAVQDGSKTFEIRKNDRGFQKGDFLFLQEYILNPWYCDHYTGETCYRAVEYVLSGFGLQPDYVCLGLRSLTAEEEHGRLTTEN